MSNKNLIVCDVCKKEEQTGRAAVRDPVGWSRINIVQSTDPQREFPPARFRLRPEGTAGEMVATMEPSPGFRGIMQQSGVKHANLDLCSECSKTLRVTVAGKVVELVADADDGFAVAGYGGL